ncbi:MAG: hypothetical protein U9N53_03195, partial [Bacteroidota bacterium]|nr:hypothetical protein [Bacteroidota bacterium]
YYRWRYFWDSRVGPDGDQEKYIKVWHEIHDTKKTTSGGKSSGLSWEFVGPYDHQINDLDNWIGRVSCLAADPNNQNIIYAGANTGGLWKTTNPLDVEPHWKCLTDDYAEKPHT